ncbi:MAG: phycobilisome degradation protein NblA [Cyanobacteria bacterium J06627_32]
MDILGQLSPDQEQELQKIKEQAESLSLELTQSYIVEIMRQIMIRDNLIAHLLTTNGTPQQQYAQSIVFQSKSF